MKAPGAVRRLLFAALLCLNATNPRAVQDLHVIALFKDRAVVVINGKRRLLSAGETSPEGVRLLSADAGGAVLEYQGVTLERRLDGRARAARSTAAGPEYRLYRDATGMYRSVGSINGLTVNFLVDTGASAVAMNASQARRLGIDYLVEGSSTFVTTASDVIRAYKVKLDVVRLGPIELRSVDAVIMEGTQPREVLLGMSFLGRLELVNDGNLLIIKRKY
jgi:aspartyl protease family protein